MKIPDKLALQAIMFMDGANGYSEQQFRNEEFGINVLSVREKRGDPWKRFYSIDRIPNKVFNSQAEFKNAIAKIED